MNVEKLFKKKGGEKMIFKKIFMIFIILMFIGFLSSCKSDKKSLANNEILNNVRLNSEVLETKGEKDKMAIIDNLSDEVVLKIKHTYLNKLNKQFPSSDHCIDKINIKHYFGTYENSIVVMMEGDLFSNLTFLLKFSIDDVDFVYNSEKITVWINDTFYELKEAYEKGLLSKSDLEKISVQHKHLYPHIYK